MPVNWDEFDRELEEALDRAEKRTDERLASRVSSVTRLTDEEIAALFPSPADVKKLVELMKIVKAAGDRNNKINKLAENIQSLGGTVLTLLEKFA